MFQIALQAMRKCYFVFTLIVAVCYTTNLFAWGKRGHGIVAEIAFYNLDDATKTKVKKYIGDMSIEQAANWMDDVRSDHKYDYMKPWHYVNVDKAPSAQDGTSLGRGEEGKTTLVGKRESDEELA